MAYIWDRKLVYILEPEDAWFSVDAYFTAYIYQWTDSWKISWDSLHYKPMRQKRGWFADPNLRKDVEEYSDPTVIPN